MKMDWLRKSILGGILVVIFLLFIRWNEFKEKNLAQIAPPASSATATEAKQPTTGNEEFQIPSAVSEPGAAPTASPSVGDKIRVTTDNFFVDIDTLGGDISKVALRKYYAELNQPENPFVLLENTSTRTYIARSGLTGPNGTDGADRGRPQFNASASSYEMAENQQELRVDLTFEQGQTSITKRFIFTRGSHLIQVEYDIHNKSDQPWQASLVGSIKRDSYNPTRPQMFAMNPFLGAATSTAEVNYQKFSFSDLASKPFDHVNTGGWIALVQHYFLTAWVPPQDSKNTYVLQKVKDADVYILSFTSEPILVAANSQKTFSAGFYAGPKDIKALEKIAPHLDLTMDYSWLWWVAKPLFSALSAIQGVVVNWGVAIIILTLCVKALFFYPSAMSYKSMAKMRKVQPKMLALKERYGDDRQKMSQELMKLYRDEKVNPVSGCLPMLIQMPVFLALYWVLMEAVELRHAPFYFWITDLSVKDPYFVLPLIMGLTMYIQQKLNPTPPDPMQAKMMQMMPFIFTFLFVFFPAGLVLYWVVNNTLSIIQQYVITKKIEANP